MEAIVFRKLAAIFRLMRPGHWVKNFFVFIPAFFASRLTEWDIIVGACLGFLSFCCLSSAVYSLNDMVDMEFDRNHPDKQNRPLANGELTRLDAIVVVVLMAASGIFFALPLKSGAVWVSVGYFGINMLYSLWLKHLAIIDVSVIGLGFLLRVFMGGTATGVVVSDWLIVLTFLLALILGLAKRRGEYLLAMGGTTIRKSLEGYNLPFLDAAMVVSTTISVVAYLMYCFSPEVMGRIGSNRIYYTAIFVVLGVFRYLQLTLVYQRTESPVRALAKDHFLQLVLMGWIGAFIWLLYLRNG
jgi:4-hydroxybenzoate polyprenyltransferase